MARKYVNSAAAGANDGTSESDAWTSLASSTGVAAGDEIWVAHTHSEDPGAAATYNWSNGVDGNPVKIVSVNFGTDVLTAGATIAQTVSGRTIALSGAIYVDGMTFNAADSLTYAGLQQYRNCTLGIVVSTAGRTISPASTSGITEFQDCTFNFNTANQNIANAQRSKSVFRSCVFNFNASVTTPFSVTAQGVFELYDCDISAGTTMFTVSGSGALIAHRCRLGTYTNLFGTISTGSFALVSHSVTGTISAPTKGLIGFSNGYGTVLGDTGRYRDGGASDGITPVSWSMTPAATAEEQIYALRTPPMSIWVAGGSGITVTIYVAGGAEIYDDEFWIELEGPDDSNTSQGYFYSSRLPWLGTRAALTSDSSTWNGAGVGTVRKVSHTYTPNHAGPLVIRCCYAKTSGAAIYLDPKIDIGGNSAVQWMAEAMQFNAAAAAGGGSPRFGLAGSGPSFRGAGV